MHNIDNGNVYMKGGKWGRANEKGFEKIKFKFIRVEQYYFSISKKKMKEKQKIMNNHAAMPWIEEKK